MANQNFNNAYNPSKAPGQDYYMSGHHHQQRLDPQTLQPPVYQGYQGQNSRSSSHYLSPITYQNYPGWQWLLKIKYSENLFFDYNYKIFKLIDNPHHHFSPIVLVTRVFGEFWIILDRSWGVLVPVFLATLGLEPSNVVLMTAFCFICYELVSIFLHVRLLVVANSLFYLWIQRDD